jgi:anti-anti-sigma regulatory factor
MTETGSTIEVRGDLDLASAPAERERILALLDAHDDRPIAVSLRASDSTQPALQVFFATLKEARLRGVTVSIGHGPDPASIAGLSLPGEDRGQ